MSDFGDAFDRAYCALKHARFLADLGYRRNRRFRLWECAADVLAAKIDALHERHERACRSAEDAEWERDGLCDRCSQMLPPLPAVPFSRAYGLPADFEFR